MSVRIFYVDESPNDTTFCLTALAIRHANWTDSLDKIVKHRAALKEDYGFYSTKEIHARDLVGGRGNVAKTPIGRASGH